MIDRRARLHAVALAKGLHVAAFPTSRQLQAQSQWTPSRISIKTMKTVESIEARLARIENALGIGDPVGHDPLQQYTTEAEASEVPKNLASRPRKGNTCG